MPCTLATLEAYRHTVGKVLLWIENRGLIDPLEVTARRVRGYLFQLIDADRKDTTLQANVQALRTLLRFGMPKDIYPRL